MTAMVCARCKVSKPLEELVKDQSRKHGRQRFCKLCANDRHKERRRNHREKVNETMRDYYRKVRLKSLNLWEEPGNSAAGKACTKCEAFKNFSEFNKNSQAKDGLAWMCKMCTAKYKRGAHKPTKLYMRARRYQIKYGITIEDYERILEKQGGKCALCSKAPVDDKPFDVDHDHVTGQVRGLLCNLCNRGLGLIGDSLEAANRVVRYLETTQERLIVCAA